MTGHRFPHWLYWVAVPLLGLALLLAVFRWDWLIPLVEARASAALGRPVSIQHLHVSLGRTLGISLEGLRIANPPGFPEDPPLAVVPRLDLALELLPLLHSEMVIPRIALHQPALTLLADDQGRANYSFDFGE